MARPLVLEFQDDPNTWRIADQWLLGDALLVAPILDESNRRALYLPAGVWTDWWTGERVEGGRWLAVTATLDTMPLYLREGAIVPMGPVMPFVDAEPTGEITLRIGPFSSSGFSRFVVPVNEERIPVRYEAKDGKHLVTVGRSPVRFQLDPVSKGSAAIRLARE